MYVLNPCRRFHELTYAVVERLYERAHEYANLSNRAGAIATDLVLACEEYKLSPKTLHPMRSKIKKRKRSMILVIFSSSG